MKPFVIGLVGEIGSGKDTAAKGLARLARPKRCRHLRTSAPLYKHLDAYGLEHTRENLQDAAIMMKQKFGDDILARAMARKMEIIAPEDIVIYDCIRWHDDLKVVDSYPNVILYVTADQKLRWMRCRDRKQKLGEESHTFDEFQASELKSTETSIHDLRTMASYAISNDGTRREFVEKLSSFWAQIVPPRYRKVK